MLFKSKKKHIQEYLEERRFPCRFSPFECLLDDYINKAMKRRLIELGLKSRVIYIDWHPEHRCIDIQAKYQKQFFELRIDPDEFSIGIDPDEVEECIEYPLESKEQVYAEIVRTIDLLNQ